MSKRLLNTLSEMTSFAAGSALYGFAMNMFLKQGNIVMGGITGISTTLNILFATPIGIGIILLNVPLVLLNIRVSGLSSMIRTVAGIIGASFAVDLLTMLPVTLTDPLLCALFGGVTLGIASGILFTRGYTTGGSDLAAYMLKRKYQRISTGRFILIIDAFVIIGSAMVTSNYEGIIYSCIAIFAYTSSIDLVLGGADKARLAYIISPKYDEIASQITDNIRRGVTILYGRGWYTKSDKSVLMCVVKRSEEFKLKEVVGKVDPEAFIILSEATQVLGTGFKEIE